jgi:hypothetical protein
MKLSSASKLWRRIAPRSTTSVVVAMSMLFGALLVLGIFYRVQGTPGVSTAYRFGVGARPASDLPLDANDPVARFAQTRVGHVLFVSRSSDQCQRVLFDNSSGVQYESASIDCVRPAAEAVASTDRMSALRKTFQK